MFVVVSAIIVFIKIWLNDGFDGLRSSTLHCCTFTVARKQSIISTFNSVKITLLCKVDGEVMSLNKSVTKMVPALSKQYHVINCVSVNNSNTFFLCNYRPLLETPNHLRNHLGAVLNN